LLIFIVNGVKMENFPEFYMSSEFDNLKHKWKLIQFLEQEKSGHVNTNIYAKKQENLNENDYPISKLKLMLFGET